MWPDVFVQGPLYLVRATQVLVHVSIEKRVEQTGYGDGSCLLRFGASVLLLLNRISPIGHLTDAALGKPTRMVRRDVAMQAETQPALSTRHSVPQPISNNAARQPPRDEAPHVCIGKKLTRLQRLYGGLRDLAVHCLAPQMWDCRAHTYAHTLEEMQGKPGKLGEC